MWGFAETDLQELALKELSACAVAPRAGGVD